MSYTPSQACVYLKAMAGFLAGIIAGKAPLSVATGDHLSEAQMADIFAQEMDQAWAAAGGGAPTNFEDDAILNASASYWSGRSRLVDGPAFSAGNYTAIAQGLVALVLEGNAVVVGEGINPNACGGGGGPAGINQLTGDVLAGPGSGSQAATVVQIQGQPFSNVAVTKGQFVMGTAAGTFGPISLSGDVSASAVTAGLLTVTQIQGQPFSNSAVTTGQIVVGTSASHYGPASVSGDVSASVVTPGLFTVTQIQGQPFSNSAVTTGQFVVGTSASHYGPASISGDVSASTVTPGLFTVTAIQGNAFTAGAPTKGQFVVATSASAYGPVTISGDLSESAVTAGLVTVTGIQGNTFTSGSPTKGQFVVATSTSNYGPVTLTGDLTESAATAGLVNVTGIQNNAVPAPTGTNTVLQWTGAAFQWGTVGGGLTAPVTGTIRTETANYTLDSTASDYIIFADTASVGAFTLTLPAPTNGRCFVVIDSKGNFGTAALTLAPHSTEKINGLNVNKGLTANWGVYNIYSNGTDWFVN